MLAVGNLGKELHQSHSSTFNTYMSRDGGLNWFEVRKGPHIYEIGDYGGLILLAPMETATREILFSWDEGKSWQKFKISDTPIQVSNIIIEPDSVS